MATQIPYAPVMIKIFRPNPLAFALTGIALVMGVFTHAQAGETHCRYIGQHALPIRFAGLSPTIEGTLNGKSMQMLLDTGASDSFLFPVAVKQANLHLEHNDDLSYGAAGISWESSAWVKEIKIGPLHAEKIDMRVVHATSDDLRYGVDLGARFLFRYDMEMSLAEQFIKFFAAEGCSDTDFLAYWDPNAVAVPMKDMGESDERKSVTVQINGHDLRALIDSGAGHSVIYLKMAEKIGLVTQPLDPAKAHRVAAIGKEAVSTWVVPFDTFQIGDELIQHGKIGVTNSRWKDHEDMILGADFLRAHRLLFAVSQKRLYFSYLGGNVFYTDPRDDIAWYQKAAELGNADAQFSLALLYDGEGPQHDAAKALEWYGKAAEQGDARAQVILGHMYNYGEGTAKDYAKAAAWYRKAAEQGYALGEYRLGNMYRDGYGVPKDEKQAMDWYQKAADLGNSHAQFSLAYLYQNGIDVPQDTTKALEWYGKSAEQGNAGAQRNLGSMYEIGQGTAKDYAKAVSWYRKAAEQGDAWAEYFLGSMYQDGKGVPKDQEKAMDWYAKAAQHGNGSVALWGAYRMYFLGKFSESVKILENAESKESESPYTPIWLYIAESRIGDAEALKKLKSRRPADSKWTTSIIDNLLGKLSDITLFDLAKDKDAKVTKGQMCEANFYVAEKLLLNGKTGEARPLLEVAVRDCPTDFIEFEAAQAELDRFKLQDGQSSGKANEARGP